MSILIRNIEFPKSCRDCFLGIDECWGAYRCMYVKKWGDDTTRAEDCPLVEVPEFCGDLIERDAALDACEFIGKRNDMEYLGRDNYAARYEEIEKIPAVIKAE